LAPLAIAALAKALESEDERVVVAAATQILDRGYGKPAQTVNAKIEGVDIARPIYVLARLTLPASSR